MSVFNGMASHRGSDRTLIFMYTMKIQGQKKLVIYYLQKKKETSSIEMKTTTGINRKRM